MYSIIRWAAFIVITLLSLPVFADSQRIVDYQYDGAGNIVGIRSGRNFGPPDVTQLNPAFVNQGSSIFVEATGVNLFRADVTTAATGISVSNVFSTETKITFILSANETAAFGLAPLTFTTRLGSDTENITVAERTPVISTEPNPIVLASDAQPVLIKLVFDQPFTTDQTYDLAIRNTSFATVSQASITLLAGETEVSVDVTGLAAGTTALEINQLADFIALAIPVIVNDNQLPAGTFAFYAKPVGVAAFIDQDVQTSGIFTSQPVGVAVFIEQQVQTNGIFTSQPVGVAAFIEQDVQINGIFVTQPVGASLGTVVDQISPQIVSPDTAFTLILTGFELNTVTAVSFIPADGVTITGGLTVTPDGRQLDIPIDIDVTAPLGTRVISLTTSQGDVLISQLLIIE